MTVIVCLDNANGMMFNHRRQSRDANVVKDRYIRRWKGSKADPRTQQ